MSNAEGASGSGPDLGTIKREDDLRRVWEHEAADFTPWLMENIGELGDSLGIRLEVEEREAPVGSYSLDILARDVENNRQVVIENQLEATDNPHLGQLLTYAAGYEANVIVWIARDFRDEHRDALDFLNRRTGEDTEFFGVEVELWRIDDSRPAVNFNLVATPNEWRKQTVRAAGRVPERRRRYREFWRPLTDTLREEHNFIEPQSLNPKSYRSFPTVHAEGVKYDANFYSEKRAVVKLYIGGPDKDWNKELFDQLEEHKGDLEVEFGETFEWDRRSRGKTSEIRVVRPGSIDDDEETLAEIRAWMVERLLKFKRVFGPRLDELVV